MSDFEDDGLCHILVSDSENTTAEKKAKRTEQTEKDFEAVRKTYVVKIENGNIFSQIQLPLSATTTTKMDMQQLVHAIEELYFFKKYQKALDFADKVLSGPSRAVLDPESLHLVQKYAAKCEAKIHKTKQDP